MRCSRCWLWFGLWNAMNWCLPLIWDAQILFPWPRIRMKLSVIFSSVTVSGFFEQSRVVLICFMSYVWRLVARVVCWVALGVIACFDLLYYWSHWCFFKYFGLVIWWQLWSCICIRCIIFEERRFRLLSHYNILMLEYFKLGSWSWATIR